MKTTVCPSIPASPRLPRLRSLLSLREAGGAGAYGVSQALESSRERGIYQQVGRGSQK